MHSSQNDVKQHGTTIGLWYRLWHSGHSRSGGGPVAAVGVGWVGVESEGAGRRVLVDDGGVGNSGQC